MLEQKLFLSLSKGYNHILKAISSTLGSSFGLKNLEFMYIGELDTCIPNFRHQKIDERMSNNFYDKQGCVDIEIQEPNFRDAKCG